MKNIELRKNIITGTKEIGITSFIINYPNSLDNQQEILSELDYHKHKGFDIPTTIVRSSNNENFDNYNLDIEKISNNISIENVLYLNTIKQLRKRESSSFFKELLRKRKMTANIGILDDILEQDFTSLEVPF